MSGAGAAGAPTRRRRRRAPPGSTPGTLIADPDAQRPRVRIIGYGPDDLEERTIERIEEIEPLIGRWPVTWVNVEGLADLDLIRGLGALFGLHRLALEDVVNVHQRAKVEEYEDHLFIVTRMVEANAAPETEQMTLFLDERCLLTFQERHGDGFDPIRERIRGHRGQIRSMGPDYLAYALLDAVIDGYFPVLEAYGEELEEIEDAVMSAPESAQVGEIHGLKRDLLSLRRAVWPQREMIHGLGRDGLRYVSDQTRIYLRDCYDHTVQLIDVLETYREIASGLVDIYLSSVSARMNEVMKVLTIIATIFIPLGFVASVYGMNFDPDVSPWNMPELRWAFGYPMALGIMTLVALGLLAYFRAKGWLGGPRLRR
ncbi:MAG TPA: magnesium/cobalt transporter CorA [Kiloniellales bacterium]|nr:magnesium/cobalt transporter CorA [Kiloniellales bacterium]